MVAILLACCGGGVACATPSPEPSIAIARQAIERAEDLDARRYAAQDLARANDALRKAERARSNRADWIEARRLAEKAAVDAEVAAARAGANRLHIAIEEIRKAADAVGPQ
ncbi:MAG: DUF4398 domain-containing protein [Myxococcota bacterium]|nr:DUF4398 domain-containing protein [Myxococcota bacterium]